MSTLRVRWLGRVSYREADQLQRALVASDDDRLLLLEHPPTITLGSRARPEHVLVPADELGAELVQADRGGDVTYHGPGQLVGYPIITLPAWSGRRADPVAYVRRLEAVLVRALCSFDVDATAEPGLTGVWAAGAKVAAIGVRVEGCRTRHGFAINVDPDLKMFQKIIPCGIANKGVTSLHELMQSKTPSMNEVVTRVQLEFASEFGYGEIETQAVETFASRGPRRAEAHPAHRDRPEWMRVTARMGPEYRELKSMMRDLDLHTVCEEAGCPNIWECWSQRTATFMILGERCTRNCGFCLVDTRKPLPPDEHEPQRVADAVARMGLEHVVITCVARDDLGDDGASVFAATVAAVRRENPSTRVELLISDCRGHADSLATIFEARPDVLNHNLETVARLQRQVRPSAGYARSLAVLARARTAGLLTKSGIMLGLGETEAEVVGALADLRAVGVDLVTIGQYLRPSDAHLPIARWWTPEEFDAIAIEARALGFAHVEAGPLVRSSYHARDGADAVTASIGGLPGLQ